MSRVQVYSDAQKTGCVVARVEYTNNLDCVECIESENDGYHKGLTRLKSGEYVLVVGSDWQGDINFGFICTADIALKHIIASGNFELLSQPRFKELKTKYDEYVTHTINYLKGVTQVEFDKFIKRKRDKNVESKCM